jgi:hypothetical protein
MASDAVARIRSGDPGVATMRFIEDEVELLAYAEDGEVGAVASALPATLVGFVYGAVLLDESKGGLDVAAESLARRKLVLITWVGGEVPPTERGKVSELRQKLRDKLPGLQAHVEIQCNSEMEAEHASIVQRVKTASGAFYDSGAGGADQTVEACAEAIGSASVADPTSKPKPPGSARGGGRRLVKRNPAGAADAEPGS